jgi:hypothetical protein
VKNRAGGIILLRRLCGMASLEKGFALRAGQSNQGSNPAEEIGLAGFEPTTS